MPPAGIARLNCSRCWVSSALQKRASPSCRSARRSAWSSRALAAEPKLLLLDEPASGLNHEEVGAIGALIRSLRERLQLTILVVEHHMQLLMSLSDWVVALNFGKRIAEGTPAQVREHPELVRAYLGS
jgi:branched-chain amino acid transport system ATP-binding protein